MSVRGIGLSAKDSKFPSFEKYSETPDERPYERPPLSLRPLLLKPFHLYFHVNVPLTKDHPSFETSSVQFSPLTDWVVRGTRGTVQQRSSSSLFCRRPL